MEQYTSVVFCGVVVYWDYFWGGTRSCISNQLFCIAVVVRVFNSFDGVGVSKAEIFVCGVGVY